MVLYRNSEIWQNLSYIELGLNEVLAKKLLKLTEATSK